MVASEVKQARGPDRRSTEKTIRHLDQVRIATGASVTAVERIEQTITEVNTTAGSIAALARSATPTLAKSPAA